MADSSITIKDSTGTDKIVDTRTETTNAEHRQVFVLGDPTANANVAAVSLSGAVRTAVAETALGAVTTGSVTSSSTTVGPVDVSAASGVSVTVHGTYAGVNLTFEASDDTGTTWYPVFGQRADTLMAEAVSGVLPSNASRMWTFTVYGADTFRARSTAYTSGTGTVRVVPSTHLSDSIVTAVTRPAPASVATQSSVSASVSSVTVLAANVNRLGATVFNDSAAALYLLLGAGTASTTVYSVLIPAANYYEVPFGFTGQLTGIWSSATGSSRISELTGAV